MSAPLSGPDLERLLRLLDIAGSTDDGKSVTAIRHAKQLLAERGLTFRDVIGPGHAPALEAGSGGASAQQQRKPAVAPWRDFVETCLQTGRLNQWETEFCEGFIERGWDEPTEKQKPIFERIGRKCGVDTP